MPECFTDRPLLTERFDAALHYDRAPRPAAAQGDAGSLRCAPARRSVARARDARRRGRGDRRAAARVVEDGGGRAALAYIEEHFGANVAAIVLANSDTVAGEEPKAPWHERKRAYIAAFPRKTPAALRVSLADKLHNARSILTDPRVHGDALWSRFGQGRGLATRVPYRELAAAFEREAPRLGEHAAPAIDELRRVVDAITALAEERQGPDTPVSFDWD